MLEHQRPVWLHQHLHSFWPFTSKIERSRSRIPRIHRKNDEKRHKLHWEKGNLGGFRGFQAMASGHREGHSVSRRGLRGLEVHTEPAKSFNDFVWTSQLVVSLAQSVRVEMVKPNRYAPLNLSLHTPASWLWDLLPLLKGQLGVLAKVLKARNPIEIFQKLVDVIFKLQEVFVSLNRQSLPCKCLFVNIFKCTEGMLRANHIVHVSASRQSKCPRL